MRSQEPDAREDGQERAALASVLDNRGKPSTHQVGSLE